MTKKETDGPAVGLVSQMRHLNDIGAAYEKASHELEGQLTKNPHRDKVAARNALTLDYCEQSASTIAGYLAGSPGGALWARLANALNDRVNGAKPGLFFDIEPKIRSGGNRSGSTAGSRAQGWAALALEALISGGSFKQTEALKWLDREIAELQIRTVEGDLVTGRQISTWRYNFRRSLGSRTGRNIYNHFKETSLCGPFRLREDAEDAAHMLLVSVKNTGNNELPKAQRYLL